MRTFSSSNFIKLKSYIRRNGLWNALSAAAERLRSREAYQYEEPAPAVLAAQRSRIWREQILFSIVTPAYHTKESYLRDMIESVLVQSYPYLELILADASGDDSVKKVVDTYQDKRIRYIRLMKNAGIAENTNRGIEACSGGYIGLLDHDDVLTPDALYEMAIEIEREKEKGICPRLLYSDEDKCSGSRDRFFEPHRKEDFNLDLLMSNNYFCHFLVLESGLMDNCMLRSAYDGAQDYDLVLRAAKELMGAPQQIVHIPKVLYHWRCHEDSTAQNPESKIYAYQAGEEALKDFVKSMGWKGVQIRPDRHMGFYRQKYTPDIMTVRSDVGAVGGRLLKRGRMSGGIYRDNGTVLYQGLYRNFSGYMNRAAMAQNADAVDIRRMTVRPECEELFRKITGVPYQTDSDGNYFDSRTLKPDTDFVALSLKLCRAIREAGYRIVWDPEY